MSILLTAILLAGNCDIQQEMYENIMVARQKGININKVKKAVPDFTEIVDEAYKYPRRRSDKTKLEEAIDFGELGYNKCVEVKNENPQHINH